MCHKTYFHELEDRYIIIIISAIYMDLKARETCKSYGVT
jgi:hypothetical protein